MESVRNSPKATQARTPELEFEPQGVRSVRPSAPGDTPPSWCTVGFPSGIPVRYPRALCNAKLTAQFGQAQGGISPRWAPGRCLVGCGLEPAPCLTEEQAKASILLHCQLRPSEVRVAEWGAARVAFPQSEAAHGVQVSSCRNALPVCICLK